jgi:hypothetical protein
VLNQSQRSNIPEDRSNKKLSCAQQLGFHSVLPADLGLSRVIDRVLPQCFSGIDEIEVFEQPIEQRPPYEIDLSLWTVSMLWSQFSDNDEAGRWLCQMLQTLCKKSNIVS